MLKYTGKLYAKIGRKYIPTGKTGADWDRMESLVVKESSARPTIGSKVFFNWDGVKRFGLVTTYNKCADGHFEVKCDDMEVFVLNVKSLLPNV
jgi:hypothetical protein